MFLTKLKFLRDEPAISNRVHPRISTGDFHGVPAKVNSGITFRRLVFLSSLVVSRAILSGDPNKVLPKCLQEFQIPVAGFLEQVSKSFWREVLRDFGRSSSKDFLQKKIFDFFLFSLQVFFPYHPEFL